MQISPDVIFVALQAGLALATFMVLALLFVIFYQVAIKPDLQAWRRNREAKASRAHQMRLALKLG
jgi:hypothetical protein